MQPSGRPFVKVCCIANIEEAQLAIAAGASALGLVSAMPSGPGAIADARIGEIAMAVPPPIATFLLTALQDADAIVEQHRRCRTTAIQLVDQVAGAELKKLRQRLPGIKLVQVIHVCGEESVAAAHSVHGLVDALLLDSGNQSLPIKELGGTGRTHDWRLSCRIRQELPLPVFLAGGLSADNVLQAITTVQPFGLDLCSSVRSDGALDQAKLNHFMAVLNAQFGAR